MSRHILFLKWRLYKLAMKNEHIERFMAKRTRRLHLADSLYLGMSKNCAGSKDLADLARGTPWMLRNARNEPIQRLILAAPMVAAPTEKDKVLWKRVIPIISDEAIIALRGRAQQEGRHLGHYLDESRQGRPIV